MNALYAVLLVIAVAYGQTDPCTLSGYGLYLDEHGWKCDLASTEDTCPTYFEYAFDVYEYSCQYHEVNKSYVSYNTHLTDIADWDEAALEKLMTIYFDFTGAVGSRSIPETPLFNDGTLVLEEYGDCQIHAKRKQSGAPKPEDVDGICHRSHVYAVANAIEAAYYRDTGRSIRVSVDYLDTCVLTGEAVCLGAHPHSMLTAAVEAGIATEEGWQNAKQDLENGATESICNIVKEKYAVNDGQFFTDSLGTRNKGGLMNFFQEFVPVAVMAVDYDKLRYVDKMEQSEASQDDYFTISPGYNHPSLFAVVSEYFHNSITNTGYWKINTNILPCMPISLYVPMMPCDDCVNFAAICGYVGGIKFVKNPDLEFCAFHPYNITLSKIPEGETEPLVPFSSPEDYLNTIRTACPLREAYKNTKFFAFYAEESNFIEVLGLINDVAEIVEEIDDRHSLHAEPLRLYFVMPVDFYVYLGHPLTGAIERLILAVQPQDIFFDGMGVTTSLGAFTVFSIQSNINNLRNIHFHNLDPTFYAVTDIAREVGYYYIQCYKQEHLETVDFTSWDPADQVHEPIHIRNPNNGNEFDFTFSCEEEVTDLCSKYGAEKRFCQRWWEEMQE